MNHHEYQQIIKNTNQTRAEKYQNTENPRQISQNSKSIGYDPITHEISSESTQ